MIDPKIIKKEFPVFKNNSNLVYLDSANTSLTPQIVIHKLVEYYENYPANIKRGIYSLSERATAEFEETRKVIASFINAKNKKEVIFTRGTTESINLVAYSLGRKIVNENDEVVVSVLEHHSNFVPWQVLAQEMGAVFKVIDINDEGILTIVKDNSSEVSLDDVITKKTKILALAYISNVLGTVNPLKEIIKKARQINPHIVVVVDAAQAVAHRQVDVQDLDCDFLAFSAHKMFGPKGAGILWGKEQRLEEMFPFQYGGEMIEQVKIEKTTFAKLPEKFEAGTPSIADVTAFKEAVKLIQKLGFSNIQKHEKDLVKKARAQLLHIFGKDINIYGPQNEFSSIVTFNLKGLHPHDVASLLNDKHVCIRAGHHCTMPLHTRFGIPASCRASFSIYNNEDDIEALIKGLLTARKLLTHA
ncbi:hypothetical protein A3G67_04580 [Candidatus Roizmanbacteria bacterium RIFCSPLOWO2_12_FULL_40_12]|uniref:Cysteine desulfurase n=1 Tax=Candidatus Roizmanbacteria bacterium RIFCSPLOWO2_01_FULL_40_42 TaxID=1802066 RepID=A0A1F7J4Q2_9BACT|nr:MAG: hypothetical protein A2779_04570 [Candidatus Roizmanbacteria bacterium RIFCSPHIGHO2_01_FULL_40_98]OGK27349.1 MAG: hypothetical protein A3C31_04895 [Candidatus Roizmanbacteria bacterium RIFCSPHIGHO2_02_FULL_40_53]OGK30779.1 MAG: hypothetical protein A2W49_02145 [Candidatus Roizmanbacteria bacterium RIFCSPHIGHO2_12_41_18]OGK36454.1 MAG: hypothetical protein A3E69_02520 [Candidatus Roizmanbacteria bacterium RIFCSPHIGHO2_12_FULL_40_130]OGK50582.1 MAG: hypothetical protein A3B50_02250 [Candi